MSGSSRGFGTVLRNRPFLFLWMAQAISQVAQNGANLVQIVLIVTFGNTIAPHFGIDIAFVLIVVMYLLATLLVLALPPDHHRFHPNQSTSLAQTLRDIRDGWRFVHATPAIYMPILHLTTVAML